MLAPQRKLYTTPDAVVECALSLANVGPDDTVLDIGCGTGGCVIAAALKRRARAVGLEIVPERAEQARQAAERAGVADRVRIITCNALAPPADALAGATVVYAFLTHRGVRLLRNVLCQLPSPVRVVSYLFPLPDAVPQRVHSFVLDDAPHFKHVLYLYGAASGSGLFRAVAADATHAAVT